MGDHFRMVKNIQKKGKRSQLNRMTNGWRSKLKVNWQLLGQFEWKSNMKISCSGLIREFNLRHFVMSSTNEFTLFQKPWVRGLWVQKLRASGLSISIRTRKNMKCLWCFQTIYHNCEHYENFFKLNSTQRKCIIIHLIVVL